MASSPPVLTDPPDPPSRSDSSTFADKADAWVSWMDDWAPDFNTAAQASYSNASESYANALAAAASASAVSAALWVSGTTYAIGDVRLSTVNGYPYRRLTTGGGTTDPSADTTNWRQAAVFTPALVEVAGTTQTGNPFVHYVMTNASACTFTLPASPAVGDVCWVTFANALASNVVARNGNNIMAVAEDMAVNDVGQTVKLRYVSGAVGWRLV